MSGVNVQISVTNLVQVDRLQTDVHRSPVVNQEQNADVARQEAARRAVAPMQPDRVDGKKIDPEAKREEEARKRKKRARQEEPAENRRAGRGSAGRTGLHIDYSA